jgi:hypothetical protein
MCQPAYCICPTCGLRDDENLDVALEAWAKFAPFTTALNEADIDWNLCKSKFSGDYKYSIEIEGNSSSINVSLKAAGFRAVETQDVDFSDDMRDALEFDMGVYADPEMLVSDIEGVIGTSGSRFDRD